MSKKHLAVFAQTPKLKSGSPDTAFALTGVGSLLDENPANTVLVMEAGVDGSLLTGVRAIPKGDIVATMGVLFLNKKDDDAAVRRVISSVAIAALVMDPAAAIVETPFPNIAEDTPYRLEAGDKLYAGIGVTNAAGIQFIAHYVDY